MDHLLPWIAPQVPVKAAVHLLVHISMQYGGHVAPAQHEGPRVCGGLLRRGAGAVRQSWGYRPLGARPTHEAAVDAAW